MRNYSTPYSGADLKVPAASHGMASTLAPMQYPMPHKLCYGYVSARQPKSGFTGFVRALPFRVRTLLNVI